MHHPIDRIAHTIAFVAPVVEHWLLKIRDQSDDPLYHERTLHHRKINKRKSTNLTILILVLMYKYSHGAMGSSDRSFMVDPLSYFSFQPVLHDWCNKGSGMCYPVNGMVHIKEPLLLIGKSGGSRFPYYQNAP